MPRTLRDFTIIILLTAAMLSGCQSPSAPTPTLITVPISTPTPTSPPALPATPTPSPLGSPTPPIENTSTASPSPSPTLAPTPDTCGLATEGPLAGVDPRGLTLVWWHSYRGSWGESLEELVAQFNQTNTCGITVVAQMAGKSSDLRDKMYEGLQGGDLPALTIGFQSDEAFYQKMDGLADLNLYANDPRWGLSPADIADFYPGFWSQSVHPAYDNQRLGIPSTRSMELMYYNVTWARELGFDHPPTTPEEFEEQACAASGFYADDADPANDYMGGYVLRDNASAVAAWTFAFGGEVLDPTGRAYVFNSRATIDALTMLKRLYDDHCAYFFEEDYPDPELAARHALFTQGSSAGLPSYADSMVEAGLGDQFIVLAIPHTTTEPRQVVYGSDLMIVKATPEQQLAAWVFIKWLTSTEIQVRWVKTTGYFPTRASASGSLADYRAADPQWAAASDLLPYAVYEPQLVSYQLVRYKVQDAFDAIMQSDDANIEEILDALTQTANQLQVEQSR